MNELIDRSGDIRLALLNGEAARWFSFLDDWNVLRVGIHYALNGNGANIGGDPAIVFGVSAGRENGFLSGATDHFCGVKITGSSFTHNAGTPNYYTNPTGVAPVKKIGTTQTAGTSMGVTCYMPADVAYRGVMILQITKGSPNFSLLFAGPVGGSGAVSADVTDAQFLEMMELASLGSIGTVKSGYGVGSTQTLAIDEGTDGLLDSVNFAWNKTAVPLEISAVRHRKVS